MSLEERYLMANEDLAKLKIDKTAAVSRPLKRRRIYYGAGAILFIIVLVVLYFKGFLSPAVEVEVASVVQIYPSQSFTLLNASGYVVAQRKASVASKVTGRLVSLAVEEGSRVKRGEEIARLESEDVKASLDQAGANLNLAQSNLEQVQAELHEATINYHRFKNLLAQGTVSQSEYDSAEARYKKAKAGALAAQAVIKANMAALNGAKVALEYTLIRAPFDGVVLTKNADIGDIVTPLGAAANAKSAVVTMADMDSLQVEVDVSESNLEKVKLGQPCEIQLDALPETRFRGAVHMIVPTADRSKGTVLVKVKFIDKDPRVLPEMSAKAAFLERPVGPEEQKPFTAVNSAAVIAPGNQKAVFLIKGERVVETPITVGAQRSDMVEVLKGVTAGDKVVLNPPKNLKNGAKIKTESK